MVMLTSSLQMGRVDGFSSQQNRDDIKLTWTDVTQRIIKPSTSIGTFWSFHFIHWSGAYLFSFFISELQLLNCIFLCLGYCTYGLVYFWKFYSSAVWYGLYFWTLCFFKRRRAAFHCIIEMDIVISYYDFLF